MPAAMPAAFPTVLPAANRTISTLLLSNVLRDDPVRVNHWPFQGLFPGPNPERFSAAVGTMTCDLSDREMPAAFPAAMPHAMRAPAGAGNAHLTPVLPVLQVVPHLEVVSGQGLLVLDSNSKKTEPRARGGAR